MHGKNLRERRRQPSRQVLYLAGTNPSGTQVTDVLLKQKRKTLTQQPQNQVADDDNA